MAKQNGPLLWQDMDPDETLHVATSAVYSLSLPPVFVVKEGR